MALIHRIKAALSGSFPLWLFYGHRMRIMAKRYIRDQEFARSGQHCIVVLAPWASSAVPWYSLAMGLLLAGRGAVVQFVIDDSPFGEGGRRFQSILSVLKYAARVLDGTFRVDLLSDNEAALVADPFLPERLARLNATWELRGEMLVEGRDRLIAHTTPQISTAYGRITRYLDDNQADFLFVPGGVFGTSGIWYSEARRRDVRFASYDAGTAGIMIVAADGVACHLADIPSAFATISAEADNDAQVKDWILDFARSEIARRRAGTDMFQYQVADGQASKVSAGPSIVMALNSSWDAAALGPHHVFADSKSWIEHTVWTVLRDTGLDIIIRQHPAERFSFGWTSDDYQTFLADTFGEQPRIRFIAAADPVNSYELMAEAAAIVTHTSTIGIEAVIAGCPVITGSRSYYSDLGFVAAAKTLEEYDLSLVSAANGTLVPGLEQQERALIAYYASQCCNWVKTEFNPAEFRKWWGRSLHEIGQVPVVADIVTSLTDNVPISVVQHRKQMQTLRCPK